MSLTTIVFIRGSAIVVLGLLACVCARRASATVRHWAWCLSFGGLALAFVLPVLVPVWELEWLPPPSIASTTGVEPGTTALVRTIADGAALAASRSASFEIAAWGGRVFWLGVTLALGKILFDLIGLAWIRSRSLRPSAAMGAMVSSFRRHHALTGDVRVARTIRVPMASGWWRPVVLLPADAEQWDERRLELVLLHELHHLRRRDPLTTLVAQLASALYWPNPLVWLAARRLVLERERACDEAVLLSGADRIGYANELVRWTLALAGAPRSFATAMAEARGLKSRVGSILGYRPGSFRLTARSAGVSGALALAVVAPCSIAVVTERAPASNVSALTDRVRSGTRAERTHALWAIGEREDRRATSVVIEVLDDPDPELRGLAAWTLGEIKDRSAVAALIEALADEDAYAREMAARALGEVGSRGASRPLRGALADPEPGVRAAAIWGLGELGDGVREPARALLDDPSPRVRREAARQLTRYRVPKLVETLVVLLDDEDPRVREEAAFDLGRLGDERAVEPLIAALRDGEASVRDAATWALDEINPSRRR